MLRAEFTVRVIDAAYGPARCKTIRPPELCSQSFATFYHSLERKEISAPKIIQVDIIHSEPLKTSLRPEFRSLPAPQIHRVLGHDRTLKQSDLSTTTTSSTSTPALRPSFSTYSVRPISSKVYVSSTYAFQVILL